MIACIAGSRRKEISLQGHASIGEPSLRKVVELSFVLFLVLAFVVIVQSARGQSSEQTYLQIIDPLTGDGSFNFTVQQKGVGDTFVVNITVVNVTGIDTWQIGLNWNSSLLTFVNALVPSDNVFAYWNSTDEPMIVGGPVLSQSGLVLYGATIHWPGNVGFNGSGVLAQLEFRIDQRAGQTDLAFMNVGNDTFLLGHDRFDGVFDIPFVPINGHFNLSVGRTWHVPQDFLSIPEALNAASIGDAIEVAAGTYPGFTVDKAAIQVVGVGNGTIINGTVAVNADRVSLTGLTIDVLTGVVTMMISGNTVEISNNYINSHTVQTILVTGNVTTITNNFLTSGVRPDLGIEVYRDSRIVNNTLKGYSTSIVLDGDDNEVSGNDFEGSISVRSSFNQILDNNVSNGSISLESLEHTTDNNEIKQNTISGYSIGVSIYYGNYNDIAYNSVSTSSAGIMILHGSYNKVTSNTIEAGLDGVKMSGSDGHDNKILSNIVRANITGINVLQAGNSSILGNSVEAGNIGIYSSGNFSANSLIIGNNISKCQTGVELSSSGWLVFHNNFVNNSLHAEDNGNNTWYNYTVTYDGIPIGMRGNYWSGWNSSQPYLIAGTSGSLDMYPISATVTYPIVIPEFSALLFVVFFLALTLSTIAFYKIRRIRNDKRALALR